MKITAFDGSPRRNSNSYMIADSFIARADQLGADIARYRTEELELDHCRGCLLCNALKRCAIRKDSWPELSERIIESDVLVFSTPIYFHHTTASMKKLLDRFRSFLKVQITEEGIIHKPHIEWSKKLFLFTAHGSSSEEDANPLKELFSFMCSVMGEKNSFESITGTRLALPGQVAFDRQALSNAYRKLGLAQRLVDVDLERNIELLKTAKMYAEELFM